MGAVGTGTREQILRVAARLIQERGYHRTAVEDILREAGTGKGNFYHYFESKEALGYAILDRIVEDVTARILTPSFDDGAGTPLEQVARFLDAFVQAQRGRPGLWGCPFGNLAAELADAHEGFRRRLIEIFEGWRVRLAEALGRARATGSLRPDADPDRLARFLVAGLEGAVLLTKLEKDVRVMEECVVELKRHVAGYRPDGPTGQAIPGEPA